MVTRVILVLISIAAAAQGQTAQTSPVAVIPRPMKMEVHGGKFALTKQSAILVTRDTLSEGQYLAYQLVAAAGLKLEVTPASERKDHASCITLRLSADRKDLGAEGYWLDVGKDRAIAEAPAPAGVFYACQTVLQLLPPPVEGKEAFPASSLTIPQVTISDTPRFPWRGLMLDTGRCYLSLSKTSSGQEGTVWLVYR